MSAHLRSFALRIILLAVIVTAATSCKKQSAEMKKLEAEPWPVVAIWAWGNYATYQDNSAPSLVVYSDGRLILKKVSPIDRTSRPFSVPTVTFWTKILSVDELAEFQERMSAVVKDPKLEAFSMISQTTDQSTTKFYFGTQGKGFFADVYGLWLPQPDDMSYLKTQTATDALPDSLFRYCAYLPVLVQSDFEPWKPVDLTVEFRTSSEERAKRPTGLMHGQVQIHHVPLNMMNGDL